MLIAKKENINYDFIFTGEILMKWESYCIAVTPWQCTMDMVEHYSLCSTLHGQPLYKYWEAYMKVFIAEYELTETCAKYRSKMSTTTGEQS